ncbi:MAG: HAD family hydrolase [Acetatifactor sp.]
MKHEMLKNKKAIIFDLDGTLVDSMWIWRSIDIAYLGRFGIELPEDLQSRIEGMSFDETAIYFKETFGITDDVEEMKRTWNEMAADKYSNEVFLKDGVEELLVYCKQQGIGLGIASSNSRELVERILQAHHLEGIFDCVLTGTDRYRGKPAPDIYLAAADRLQVEAADCLVFEDITAGIQAGKRAGMTVCAVEDAYSKDQLAEKKRLADYFIASYRELF